MSNWSFDLSPQMVPQVKTKWRTIATPIPVPASRSLFQTLEQCEAVSMHGQMPIVWDKAEGCQVSDPWGNTWIDFTSTIFVANAGHGNPEICKAIQDCIDKPLLHSYSYATPVRVEFLRELTHAAPYGLDKAFLLSAGTEATECALKLMRLHGIKQGKRRRGIICFEGNWHGRTVGAQMMGYNQEQKKWIGYLDPDIHHLPFPYPWLSIDDAEDFFMTAFETLCHEKGLNPHQDICGFMLETFQGWAAAFYPPAFVQAVRKVADEIGALVCFDEMQAGFGRTGKLFGFEHYHVQADLLCCGKGISSSLPLSAVIGRDEILDLASIGSMSSTHSANPMSCAACLANLRYILKHNLPARSAALGEYMLNRLKAMQKRFSPVFSWVLGRGLLAGLHFHHKGGSPAGKLASRICELAMQRGLILVHTGRESIKLGPPLTIPQEALDEGLDVLETCIADAIAERHNI